MACAIRGSDYIDCHELKEMQPFYSKTNVYNIFCPRKMHITMTFVRYNCKKIALNTHIIKVSMSRKLLEYLSWCYCGEDLHQCLSKGDLNPLPASLLRG
jgi:hypothetical protein